MYDNSMPRNYTREMASLVPIVVEQNGGGERSYDIYSRLLKDRIICLSDEVNQVTASILVAQLLFLESQNPEAPINFYINSPGGSITDGMSVHDTMKYIKSPVHTIGVGLCASMGAFLLASGDKRFALPNTEIMIHQPLGGARGQASDIEITAKHIIRTKEKLNRMLSEYTKQPYEKVAQDTDRDNWLTAEEAVAYGLIDSIIQNKK